MRYSKFFYILSSALIGANISVIGAFIVFSLMGFPEYGFASVLLPLYFWAGIIPIFVPLGFIIGAISGTSILEHETHKQKTRISASQLLIRIGLPTLLLLTIVIVPFLGF